MADAQQTEDAQPKKGFFERVRYVVRRARDLFPLTGAGIALAAGASLAAFYYGTVRIDLVLLVVGLVGVALVVLGMLFTTVTAIVLAIRVRKRRSGEPLSLECGFATKTDFYIGSPWFVPFVRVGWSWLHPEANVRVVPEGLKLLTEEVTPTRRCLKTSVLRRIEVSDAFGFTRIGFLHHEERPCRFTPSVGGLRTMHVVRSMAGGEDITHPDGPPEGERIDLRRYMPGDPIRFVLWKVFARTRDLVVRTQERAISHSRQTVAYLVASEGDEPAAGAARVAVESGALGSDWVLGADGPAEYAKTRPVALEVLARSAEANPREAGAGLESFMRSATPGQTGRAVVFVPAKPGPWIERVLRGIRVFNAPGTVAHPVEFVVCTDGIERDDTSSKLTRLAKTKKRELAAKEGIGPAVASDVAAVVKALRGGKTRVLVIDRMTGRVYNESHYAPREKQPVEPAQPRSTGTITPTQGAPRPPV